jgi:hypothetical protein
MTQPQFPTPEISNEKQLVRAKVYIGMVVSKVEAEEKLSKEFLQELKEFVNQ